MEKCKVSRRFLIIFEYIHTIMVIKEHHNNLFSDFLSKPRYYVDVQNLYFQFRSLNHFKIITRILYTQLER